jgi:hypothetical protein
MAGAGGQNTFIIPSHDLVVVRMGHFRGAAAGRKTLNAAFTHLMAAVPSSKGVGTHFRERRSGK